MASKALPTESSNADKDLEAGPPPAYEAVVSQNTPLVAGPSRQQPVQQQQPSGPRYNAAIYRILDDPYDTRRLYAADRRARYRFCAALFWGFFLYICLSMIVGGITMDEMRSRRHAHHKQFYTQAVVPTRPSDDSMSTPLTSVAHT